jgi:hypothetical protein
MYAYGKFLVLSGCLWKALLCRTLQPTYADLPRSLPSLPPFPLPEYNYRYPTHLTAWPITPSPRTQACLLRVGRNFLLVSHATSLRPLPVSWAFVAARKRHDSGGNHFHAPHPTPFAHHIALIASVGMRCQCVCEVGAWRLHALATGGRMIDGSNNSNADTTATGYIKDVTAVYGARSPCCSLCLIGP